MNIYPKIARNIFLPIADLVMKTKMSKYLNFLKKSQWWSENKLKELQFKKFKSLIKHAYSNVPFYRNSWRKKKIIPEDIKNFSDIKKLPIITKQDIKRNSQMFFSKDIRKRKPKLNATGGSTGEPLNFFYDWDAWSMDWASIYRGWGFAGYQLGDKIVSIGGSSLVPSKRILLKKTLKNIFIDRHLLLSAFNLDEKHMNSYVTKILKFKPRFIRGYPSSLYIFSKYCEKKNISFSFLQGIFTTAETLYPYYRKTIENSFGIKIFDEYGVRDGGANAYECKEHKGLHISVEKVLIEFIKNGVDVLINERGKMILTDLYNYSFPFIRYDVGDVGIPTENECTCGRKHTLIKQIEGREVDIITTPSGKLIPGPFFPHLLLNFQSIKEYQILQNKINEIIFKYIPDKGFKDKKEIHKINLIMKQYLGEDMHIEFKLVDNIKKPKSGKRRFVISEINVK